MVSEFFSAGFATGFAGARRWLSPNGVTYVSYNVLPGWRMIQPLRDAFLLEVPDHVDSRARVAQARDFLSFLKNFNTSIKACCLT